MRLNKISPKSVTCRILSWVTLSKFGLACPNLGPVSHGARSTLNRVDFFLSSKNILKLCSLVKNNTQCGLVIDYCLKIVWPFLNNVSQVRDPGPLWSSCYKLSLVRLGICHFVTAFLSLSISKGIVREYQNDKKRICGYIYSFVRNNKYHRRKSIILQKNWIFPVV
jgi:hypothetical protein